MDAGYISGLAALSGSVIGGLTSLTASWLSQSAQAHTQLISSSRSQRQKLYKAFIEEASRLYGDALVNDKAEIANIVGLYAMVSRMRVLASPLAVRAAEAAVHRIVDTYLAPNKTLRELHASMNREQVDPLREFSEACRDDLARRRTV